MSALMIAQERGGVEYLCQILDEVIAIDGRDVLHAVEAIETLRWVRDRSRRTTFDTVCGKRAKVQWADTQIQGRGELTDAKRALPWPPRVASMPKRMTRCTECHEATGRKRPRTTMVGWQ